MLPKPARAKDTPFDQWVDAFRAKAVAHGIADETYARVMGGVHPDTTGLEAIHSQPEFNEQLWQYLNRRVSDWRIIAGRDKATEYAPLLARIEKDFGVEPAVMLGVWGIESTFGDPIVQQNHMRPVIPSLATLAWGEPRRRAYWAQELINALTIIQRGWSTADEMVGSWAGAMGHTQWMPEVWLHVGMDYDGDGRVSPFGKPDDALGSTARYFVERGKYRRDEHWGYEVHMQGSIRGDKSRTYAAWQALGVTRADGPSLSAAERHVAALAAGARWPGFPVGSEFLCREELQPVDELCASARPSRRPLRRRRAFRAKVPGQRTGPNARRSPGDPAPPHRPRLRHRRHRWPARQRHHACGAKFSAQGRHDAGRRLCRRGTSRAVA
jgi:membrane-bound lytic murein transglycosylase B